MAVNLFTNGAGGNTWNTAGNWSLGTVPTSSDGHVTTFDATSPDCTMGAARSCNNIDFTGYTNTLTMSTFTLTVAGNVTLDTGLIISGTGILSISTTSTITSNGYVWPNSVSFGGSGTVKTLVGNLIILGSLTISANSTVNATTSETISSNGVTLSGTYGGSATHYQTGGTWSGGGVLNKIFIFSGNSTVSGTVKKTGSNPIQYSSGVITTTGSTLTIDNDATLDTNGMSWDNLNFGNNNITITLNSLLTASGNLNCSATVIFEGVAGWTVSTFTHNGTVAGTIRLKEAITYTITNSISAYQSRTGSTILFTSAHASTKAILTLVKGATCNVLADFTRIDASGGRPIRSFNGTITDCINVVSFFDLRTVALNR